LSFETLTAGLNFDANTGGIWGKVKDGDGMPWHGTVTVQNNKLQTKTLSLTIRQGSWEAKAAHDKANKHKAKLRLESRKTLGQRVSDTGPQARRFLV
jgi:hypothetical protein